MTMKVAAFKMDTIFWKYERIIISRIYFNGNFVIYIINCIARGAVHLRNASHRISVLNTFIVAPV